MLKRSIDLAGSLVGIVVLGPLFLVIALAIKLDSPGPVLYSQTRVGRRGRTFRIRKFRSMVVEADRSGAALTGRADPRVTRVGRVLRVLRLDELPQLLNVLKGEMSLVGPRPEVPSVVARYAPEQREVLEVRPGITGPTQLAWLDESDQYPAGVDPYAYYIEHFLADKLRSDLEYVRTRSPGKDLGYLLQVPLALAKSVMARIRPESLARKLTRLAVDCLAVGLANLGAFAVRFDWKIPEGEMIHLMYGLPLTSIMYGVAFVILRTYRGVWEYASVGDLWRLGKASVLGGSLHALTVLLLGWRPYPRSVVMATVPLTILVLGGIRVLARSRARVRGVEVGTTTPRRVVIVGAGRTGEAIARELYGSGALEYELVGFVDDDVSRQGETIHGLPVLGVTAQLPDLIASERIQEAIIAIPRVTQRDLRRISDLCTRSGVDFKVLPSVAQLVRGDGKLRYLRKLNVEELLGREPVTVDEERIRVFLRGKRVMVTGAGGSIGSELCRQVLKLGAESLILVERAENALHDVWLEMRAGYPGARVQAALADVKHVPRMMELFRSFGPHVVFHAAAYKHVPILEEHPGEAVLNNVVGTKRLVDVSRAFGVERFVLISTDKAVRPQNLMGATKRICEMYITALRRAAIERDCLGEGTRFVVVRFGNVLGSAGSVIPLFEQQVERGESITIADPKVSRFFMTVSEAVGLVLESTVMESKGDIFVLDMGKPVRIADLADSLVLSLGLSPSEVGRRYVGLRPGDKLHEMLWEEGEEVLLSEDDKIFAIRQEAPSLAQMDTLVGDLEALALSGDVEALLGRIREAVPTYESTPRGARFATAEAGQRHRVLVIDDDESLRGLLREALDGEYEITVASDTREGLARARSEVPHVILLDVRLPDGDGIELCRVLRADPSFRRTPIILVTGHGDDASVVTGLRAGADDYLPKPFRLDELRARVESVLRRASWAR